MRFKEWDDTVTETYPFFEFKEDDPAIQKVMQRHTISLDKGGECITRVRGVHGAFISKLEFITNFGRKYSVGHDYPRMETPPIEIYLEQANTDPINFELEIPSGSKVVSLNGSYNTNLLSIAAHYD